MRYFLDTEFMEEPGHIELLSIALVCEDGREYYAEVANVDTSWANDWVKEHVLPHLGTVIKKTPWMIADDIRTFVTHKQPEFWGYYADYDWVVFCWLFGAMIDLPNGWPMYCRDLKQWCDDLGNPTLPSCEGEHHALRDARWNAHIYDCLQSIGAVGGKTTQEAMEHLRHVLRDDPSYAHTWHCNLAMAFYDALGDVLPHHEKFRLMQDGASRFMQLCFDVETSNDMQQ